MQKQEMQTIAITALLTSGLALLVYGFQFGFLFMFLPTLPLFSTGLSKHPRLVIPAGILASLPLALLGDIASGLFFLLLFVLPSWYICRSAMKSRSLTFSEMPGAELRIWFPVGVTLTHIAVYACALLALTTAVYATQETNLPQFITGEITNKLSDLEKKYGMPPDISAAQLSFLACALTAWFWGFALWLHALIANHGLVHRKAARRPNFTITPFPMPNWILPLMGICALAALLGGESMQFLGRACVIILLLPYCFLGGALMHFFTLNWPNRLFLLFFSYLLMAALAWPVLLLCILGIWHHLKTLNKHLSAGGTSSR